MKEIQPGNILGGPYWPEKVKAISVNKIGDKQVRIELQTTSDFGFDRSTLDNKANEILFQVGAKIEKWEEE